MNEKHSFLLLTCRKASMQYLHCSVDRTIVDSMLFLPSFLRVICIENETEGAFSMFVFYLDLTSVNSTSQYITYIFGNSSTSIEFDCRHFLNNKCRFLNKVLRETKLMVLLGIQASQLIGQEGIIIEDIQRSLIEKSRKVFTEI